MSTLVSSPQRLSARVEGVVQGVGFRPHVYKLASELGLAGFILNDERGVLIEAEGEPGVLDRVPAPDRGRGAAAGADRAAQQRADRGPRRCWLHDRRRAAATGTPATQISPDTATCDDCLAEITDPGDRRFRYPFTNCTNCGPRFTIVAGIPYDRPLTTMAGFEMCAACRAEYEDPGDRRFHAQPNACPDCGPALRLLDAGRHRDRRPAGGARRDRRGAARRGDRRGQGRRRLPPRLPRRRRAGRRPAARRASTARTSPSR